MEEDNIKKLFTNFDPELSSDVQFIDKLRRNLNSVEIIKQHNADVRSRNKKAVVIAAFIGFVVGFIFSLTLPYLSGIVAHWQLSLPSESILKYFADNFIIIAWIIIGSASGWAALSSYEVALNLLKPKDLRAK